MTEYVDDLIETNGSEGKSNWTLGRKSIIWNSNSIRERNIRFMKNLLFSRNFSKSRRLRKALSRQDDSRLFNYIPSNFVRFESGNYIYLRFCFI